MSEPKTQRRQIRNLFAVERLDPVILKWWPLPGAVYDTLSDAREKAKRSWKDSGFQTRIVRGKHPQDVLDSKVR